MLIIALLFGIGIMSLIFIIFFLINLGRPEEKNIELDSIAIATLTIIWVIFIYLQTGITEALPDLKKIFCISAEMDPNAWGDFLAGYFAPIIFIWLVFGVYIQKKEFRNAVGEYKKSVLILEKQSTLTDIQHKNTWFDRNLEVLEKHIDQIIDKKDKSLQQLQQGLVSNTINNYSDISRKIKDIVELNKYVEHNLKQDENKSILFNDALEKLSLEYNILFQENILACYHIYIKILLQIYLARERIDSMGFLEEKLQEQKDIFKDFYDLKAWLTEDQENIILEYQSNIPLDNTFIDLMYIELVNKNKCHNFIGEYK